MSPMSRLLIVDDDRDWVEMLSAALEPAGYDLVIARSGEEALQKFATCHPDLVLLDIRMPGMDGHDVCRRLRARSNVPILFVSIHGDQTSHVVTSLHEGGDDIISKVRGVAEMRARIEVILRRACEAVPSDPRKTYDDGVLNIELDGDTHVFKRGEAISLTPTERRLLKVLIDHQDEIVPHQDLLQSVWGRDYGPETEYLAVYVRYLRLKLEDNPSCPKYVVTKHRMGYGFMSGPHPKSQPSPEEQ